MSRSRWDGIHVTRHNLGCVAPLLILGLHQAHQPRAYARYVWIAKSSVQSTFVAAIYFQRLRTQHSVRLCLVTKYVCSEGPSLLEFRRLSRKKSSQFLIANFGNHSHVACYYAKQRSRLTRSGAKMLLSSCNLIITENNNFTIQGRETWNSTKLDFLFEQQCLLLPIEEPVTTCSNDSSIPSIVRL